MKSRFSLIAPLLSATLQNLSTDILRGRVMSVYSMAQLGFRPFYALGVGGLAAVAGAPPALAVFGLIAGGAAIYARRRRVAAE